jgi:hypothetical protein
MTKSNNSQAVLIGVFSVVLGLVAFALSGSIFNIFFVPVVIGVLWDYSNKLSDVEKRLAKMESGLTSKPDNEESR